MTTIVNFSSGQKAKSSEVNYNFKKSYWQGEFSNIMVHGNVNVSASTATIIKASNSLRTKMYIRNNSGVTVFIGNSNVTTSSLGEELLAGDVRIIRTTDAYYAISNSGTADVRFLEVQG